MAELPVGATPASWMSRREIVPSEPDVLLGYAVHSFGLQPTGWHQFSYPNDYGRPSYLWLQYHKGVAVGVVGAEPALVGHNLSSRVCGGGDWVPDGAVPQSLSPVAPEFAPELDLTGILAETPGFVVKDAGITFADGNDRCPAWIAFEDRLEDAGLSLSLNAGYVEPPDLDDLVDTQIVAVVADDGGAAALVSTAPGGVVTVGPAQESSLTEQSSRYPLLWTCVLDTPIAVEVRPLD